MKLSQLTESFVISNDEFEDYLNRTTEQLAQELQSGKNARDAIHDLALQFSAQHNKAYEAYVRMSDALTARMHTLELDAPAAPAAPEMGMEPEMGDEPEMMTDPMGDMEMDTPADDEMPSDSDMDDYNAVMDNEPEAEEMGESVVNEASCGCCGNDPCDCDDSCDCKKVNEAEEKPYICVHAKKGKHECHASSSYEAAKKAAAHWKMKSTAGIDAHLAVEESKSTGDAWYIEQDAKRMAEKDGHDWSSLPYGRKSVYRSKAAEMRKGDDEDDDMYEAYSPGDENEEGMVSNCCGAPIMDVYKGHGRCSDCKEMASAVQESVNESMEVINKIVADKQAGKLHGMTVDMFTASAIKQIYDAVGDENKAKLDDLMTSKEGVVKAANIAMKMMKEGKMNELAPVAAVAGGLARGAAAMAKHAPKIAKVARGVNRAVKVGKAVGGAVRNTFDRASESADTIMRTSTRASFSEYNEFYKELDKAAKAGKKAGDTIKVGGKNIKLKSDPKHMHQLSDSDMDAIDALAQRLNEKGCSSKMKK